MERSIPLHFPLIKWILLKGFGNCSFGAILRPGSYSGHEKSKKVKIRISLDEKKLALENADRAWRY
jgi:hypothetical protein